MGGTPVALLFWGQFKFVQTYPQHAVMYLCVFLISLKSELFDSQNGGVIPRLQKYSFISFEVSIEINNHSTEEIQKINEMRCFVVTASPDDPDNPLAHLPTCPFAHYVGGVTVPDYDWLGK